VGDYAFIKDYDAFCDESWVSAYNRFAPDMQGFRFKNNMSSFLSTLKRYHETSQILVSYHIR
jgi:hypothetical protein